jgi:hypothetical protein
MNRLNGLALLVLGSGLARSESACHFLPFDEVDKNGDGMISESEASKIPHLDFARADRNRDRQISRQEYDELVRRTMIAHHSSASQLAERNVPV